MSKCPKCHAPARSGPPDGDFRYVPPRKPELNVSELAQLATRHGLVLVPLEPTDEMYNASNDIEMKVAKDGYLVTHEELYKAMIEVGKVDG